VTFLGMLDCGTGVGIPFGIVVGPCDFFRFLCHSQCHLVQSSCQNIAVVTVILPSLLVKALSMSSSSPSYPFFLPKPSSRTISDYFSRVVVIAIVFAFLPNGIVDHRIECLLCRVGINVAILFLTNLDMVLIKKRAILFYLAFHKHSSSTTT
jgi:hypothetical protein